MTHLNITQGSTVETVSTLIILKLYETALTVSEPLEGETDAAYMSGHISVPSTYKEYVDYLAGTVGEGSSGVITSTRLNSGGRFLNLTIDVTNGYYIPFEDPNTIIYLNGLGIGSNNAVTTTEAALAASVKGSTNTVVTKFNELKYFTNVRSIRSGNSGQAYFRDWTALLEIDLTNVTEVGGLNDLDGGLNRCTALTTVRNASSIILINPAAFSDNSNLVTISGLSGNIPIGAYSFSECSSLTSSNFLNVHFILGLMRSGSEFSGCTSLTSIKLYSENTLVPGYCFNECTSLVSVENIQNIKTFGAYSFSNCYNLLYDLSILSGATSIGSLAFYRCNKLTGNLNIPGLISLEDLVFMHVPVSKVLCLGKVSSIPKNTFYKDSSNYNVLTEVYLPYECTTIGDSAFYGNLALTFVKLYTYSVDNWVEGQTPTSGNMSRVTTIERAAFYYCTSLSNIDLSNVTTIRKEAFKGCTSLTGTIDLSNISELGIEAFSGCSGITGVTGIGNNTTIPPLAFSGCSVSTLDFGNNVTVDGAFKSCLSLTSIRFRGTGTIQGEAFYNCTNLQSIIFDGDVVVMRNSFVKCSSVRTLDLSNISEASLFVPLNGTVMGCQFAEMNLTSVILNPNITKLPPGMFGYGGTNSLVLNITIPAGVTEIGESCFYACHANITMLSSTPPTLLGDTPLFRVHSVKVPYGSLAAYLSATGWSDYSAIISESPQS